MTTLRRVTIEGFKSIKRMDLELHALNVMLGSNGAGKSNLVSFFKMLNEMMAGRLQQYIGTSGRAQSLLHFGPKITPQIGARLEFDTDDGVATYIMRLLHGAGDTLVFAEETLTFQQTDRTSPQTIALGSGYEETRVLDWADDGENVASIIQALLNSIRVYHFHDTSPTALVRQSRYFGDSRRLLPDAGNLAALLYRLRNQDGGTAYRTIVTTIRLIAPFFDDFDLDPNGTDKNYILLNWREKGSDQIFGPHQFSDGTLRAICLITLLLQPQTELPALIVVDEPELGLHPYALNTIAALFSKASHHTQILISTQSSSFLDNFDPADIIVVNRDGRSSQFIRPDPTIMQTWLDDYSLGEVWEKNVIGGGPH